MVYGKDAKGNVSAINVNEYDKHRNQYRLLSLAELLNERQHNPKLIGQNGLFDVANNAIGLDKIKSNLKELIASLGTEDVHNENFYSKEQLKGQYETDKVKELLETLDLGFQLLKKDYLGGGGTRGSGRRP